MAVIISEFFSIYGKESQFTTDLAAEFPIARRKDSRHTKNVITTLINIKNQTINFIHNLESNNIISPKIKENPAAAPNNGDILIVSFISFWK